MPRLRFPIQIVGKTALRPVKNDIMNEKTWSKGLEMKWRTSILVAKDKRFVMLLFGMFSYDILYQLMKNNVLMLDSFLKLFFITWFSV